MKKRILGFHSIRTYIMIASLGFAMLLAVFAAAASYVISQRYLRENQRQSASVNLQLLGSEIGSDLDGIVRFCDWICSDSRISNYLKQTAAAEDDREMLRRLRGNSVEVWEYLNDELNHLSTRGLIRRILVSVPDGRHFIQNIPVYDSRNLPEPAQIILSSPFFEEQKDASSYLWKALIPSPLNPYYARKILPVVRPIRSTTSSSVVGWVYLEISDELISRRFDNYVRQEDEYLYLSLDGTHTYQYIDGTFQEAETPGDTVDFQIPGQGWRISVLPSRLEFHSRSRTYLAFILLAALLILLAGALMAAVLRRLITRPVTKLLQKIEEVGQGDFSRTPEIEWENELGDIGRGINQLSENVSALMEKKVLDEKHRQELEYRILQSQINPHFMYNTLNTIKWMASIQGADGIADMSTALSRLLKNISKGTDSMIPVSEEFRLVDDYFTIMKYRYGGTIELEYQIDDEALLSCKINRFCLQPIVENAIFHGIEPKGAPGLITIHLYRETASGDPVPDAEPAASAEPVSYPSGDGFLCIDVTDNGIGMSEEEIEKVLSGEDPGTTDFFRQVGIANVSSRIRYSGGEGCGITIESEPGAGTTTHLRFRCGKSEE